MTLPTDILAVLSLLHEPADLSSATRRFRGEAVLGWTLKRLGRADGVGAAAILCWDDQLAAVTAIAATSSAQAISQGPRRLLPSLAAVAAARRWADGWRGGPLGASAFDLGYHSAAVKEAADQLEATAVVLIDPASGLIDPALVDAVIAQHREKPSADFTFTPAATGLGAMLLTRALVDALAAAGSHPGRLLHYFPNQVSREPIAQDNCAATPTPVARSVHRFTLSSQRQVERLEQATAELNGTLFSSGAEEIVSRMARAGDGEPFPREVTLELTTRRLSRPIFSPLASQLVGESSRPDLNLQLAHRLIDELSAVDDTRLTLAGVGDPLLHADVLAIISYAASRGLAVNLESDLLVQDPARIDGLADSPADIVSIHLPALAADTYAAVMGIDGYTTALENVQRFVARRAAAGRGTPLVVPLFTKCRLNLAEMESWYDQWLRAVGSAVIVGPSTFGGLIADAGVADMAPPMRLPCRRLRNRLTVLSDGRVTSCEQDVMGRQSLGHIGDASLSYIWQTTFNALRKTHADSRWKELKVCSACSEWHRP